MGSYRPGDVVLVSVSIDDPGRTKVRPAVVVAADGGALIVCPVSSRAPRDAPGVPISIDDFAEGGLDLFGESFVMAARRMAIRSGDVIGKRGRLAPGLLAEIAGGVPGPGAAGRPGRRTPRRR
ncbi:MAG TPA: type II toxin-antitoxin system PemK/MazF family toxin [Methanoregula sp.]|nr:type II toxin-antitoxin system PemK/MazF family toxin [Methanoregula sp.]